MIIINKSILKGMAKRRPWAKKGDYGHLLVVGGSKLYTGAPLLAALAALRAGCDLVTVAAPERAANISARNLNLITYPLEGDFLTARHAGKLLELAGGKDALLIGNGLGRKKATLDAVNKFLGEVSLPCVIDADAIHAIANKSVRSNSIITPHAHEFYVLTGENVENNLKKRIELVKNAATGAAAIILKGQIAVISDGNRVALNKHISDYATKGGIGDVLAGTCGSLLAQGIAAFDAACAASYIVGAAGILAARERRQSTLATDVIEKIPIVLKNAS